MKKTLQLFFPILLMSYSGFLMANHAQHASPPQNEPVQITATPEYPVYAKECGSCHLAYPAAFLPVRSWEKLMNGLEKHFGDNAELSDEARDNIMSYLISHAAEYADAPNAAKFLGSIPSNAVPLRIVEVPYFKKIHRMMPRMLVKMGKVKSLSACSSCHDDAQTGQFESDKVRVPLMCSKH